MFSIAIVLFIIVFPILIPAAVETVGALGDAIRRRREGAARPAGTGVRTSFLQSFSYERASRAEAA